MFAGRDLARVNDRFARKCGACRTFQGDDSRRSPRDRGPAVRRVCSADAFERVVCRLDRVRRLQADRATRARREERAVFEDCLDAAAELQVGSRLRRVRDADWVSLRARGLPRMRADGAPVRGGAVRALLRVVLERQVRRAARRRGALRLGRRLRGARRRLQVRGVPGSRVGASVESLRGSRLRDAPRKEPVPCALRFRSQALRARAKVTPPVGGWRRCVVRVLEENTTTSSRSRLEWRAS